MRKSRFSFADLRRLFKYIKPDRWRFVGVALFVVMIGIPLTLWEPFLIYQATSTVLGDSSTDALLRLAGIAVLYYAGRLTVELALNYFGLRLSYRVHVRLLHDALENFIGKDQTLVKSLPRGDVLYCLFNDSMRVASFMSSGLLSIFSNVAMLIACFGLIVYLDASLSIPCVLFLTTISLLHVRFARKLIKKQIRAKHIDQDLSGRAQNMLSGIITLKAFRLVGAIVDRWVDRYRPRWDVEIPIRMIEITLASVALHAHIMFTFVILFIGLSKAGPLSVSLSAVFAFLVVYNRMAQPFQFLAGFYLDFQDTKASILRFFRLYDLGYKNVPAVKMPSLKPFPSQPTRVETLDLQNAAAIRGQEIVTIPTLHFEAGKAYLLAGPNGVGKSTAGFVLSGLLPLASGNYRMNGTSEVSPFERARILYLEKTGYWPEGTIFGNCTLSDPDGKVDEAWLNRCLEICKCDEIIASLPLKIHNPVASDWNLLSDGESQRLFLAFATYHRPEVLILDESLTHVPFDVRKQIVTQLRSELPDLVLLLISHHAQDGDLVDQVVEFPKRANRFAQISALNATFSPG